MWVFESKKPLVQQQPHVKQALFTTTSEIRTFRLYISGIDGKHMRELGYLETQTGDLPEDRWRDEFQADWLPDGKQIDFEYRNTLYTVPVQ